MQVTNLTGHKFPTGYPSRRTWLHVTIRDASGGIAFESGAITDAGSIRGNDNDADGAKYEPHYEESHVGRSGADLRDRSSAIARARRRPGLLTATQYLKDNRLLPRGFDKATARARDRRVWRGAGAIPISRAPAIACATGCRSSGDGPYRVEVELRYQSIGYRWASNLEAVKAEEPARFVSYYKATSAGSSVIVATTTVTVEPRTP